MTSPPIRVLVVDDHEIVRKGLAEVIASAPGMVVCGSAATAADAVSMAERVRPDVVLMDVRLPDASGVEAAREISALADPPRVVMLTSYSDEDALFAAVLAGVAGYLLKGVSSDELTSGIRKVAAGHSILDPALTKAVLDRLRFPAPHGDERLALLSEREATVLRLMADGLTNREIAAELFVSEKTVKNQVSRVLAKLGLARRSQAAAYVAGRQSRH